MGFRDMTTRISGDLRLGLGLLTRLPLPGEADLARGAASAWAWPLAGLAPGALAALVMWLTAGVGPGFAAALGLAVVVMSTGAMHEDGLADSADGLWGGWKPERRLEIMKDSRIGAYGVIALILSLLARWSLYATLISDGAIWGPVLATACLSRVPMVGLMAWMVPARGGGLSRAVGRPSVETALIGGGVALVIALLLVGRGAIWAFLAGLLATTAMGTVAQAKIGGQTGDILGASQQLAEIACLAVLVTCLT